MYLTKIKQTISIHFKHLYLVIRQHHFQIKMTLTFSKHVKQPSKVCRKTRQMSLNPIGKTLGTILQHLKCIANIFVWLSEYNSIEYTVFLHIHNCKTLITDLHIQKYIRMETWKLETALFQLGKHLRVYNGANTFIHVCILTPTLRRPT